MPLHRNGAGQTSKAPRYADDRTRVGYDVARAVHKVSGSLPPGQIAETYNAITFAAPGADRGFSAVLAAGRVRYTGHDGIVLVPERTIAILDRLEIPYQDATSLLAARKRGPAVPRP